MAAFAYSVTNHRREDMYEAGTVVARDELDARRKLVRAYGLTEVHIKRLPGLPGLLKSINADVR